MLDGDYTALGYITIEGRELRVSVNSEKRANRIRKEIEKRLKGQVTHQKTEVESVESMLNKPSDEPDEAPYPPMTPELQEIMDQSLDAHWKKWIDEKIPALGGITPRQAVKSKDGREKLMALLDDFERRDKLGQGSLSQLKYIQRARKQLGLE